MERKRKRSLKGNRKRLLRISEFPSLASALAFAGEKTSERFDVVIDKKQNEAKRNVCIHRGEYVDDRNKDLKIK